MEIRIKISEAEFAELQLRAKGFPSVNTYARALLFPQHDYEKKWEEVKAYIDSIKDGDVFYIRDALPNTPTLFGRWAYEQQITLGIKLDGKDRTGTNRWRKNANKYDLQSVSLPRDVCCPHCNSMNSVNLGDESTITTEERPMVTRSLYEFDYEESCTSL